MPYVHTASGQNIPEKYLSAINQLLLVDLFGDLKIKTSLTPKIKPKKFYHGNFLSSRSYFDDVISIKKCSIAQNLPQNFEGGVGESKGEERRGELEEVKKVFFKKKGKVF